MESPRPVDAAVCSVAGTPTATPTPRQLVGKKAETMVPVLGALCLLAVAGTVVWIVLRSPAIPGSKNVTQGRFCCPKQAARMFSLIDKSILPCRDFFAHVCKKAISEGVVRRGVGEDILAGIAGNLAKGTDFYASPAAANLHRFYTSCVREIWQPELRFSDTVAAVLKIANFKPRTNATDLFRFALDIHHRYRLTFFIHLDHQPRPRSSIRFVSNRLRLKNSMFVCAQICLDIILSAINAYFGTNYKPEAITQWEARFPNGTGKQSNDRITLEELREAFYGLDILQLSTILDEFSFDLDINTRTAIHVLSRDVLDEIRLLWNPSYQPLSLCHMMMTVALEAVLYIQVYDVMDSPTLRSAKLCKIHAETFGELWRRTYVAALTNQEKNIQLRSIFNATRRAIVTYAPLRKLMAAGDDMAKFEAYVADISLLLPADVILPDVPEPNLSTEGFVRNLIRTLSFEFDVMTAMRRRGVPLLREELKGARRDDMSFATETALYVPPLSFALLSSNTTDPMLADAPVIAYRMAVLLWNRLISRSLWSTQTSHAIDHHRRCVLSSMPGLSKFDLNLVSASAMALHIAAAAAVGAYYSSSSTDPGGADWHTPRVASGLNKMSNAQFFYLRNAYFRCSAKKDASFPVNAPLKLNTDFAAAFGCRDYRRVPSSLECASATRT